MILLLLEAVNYAQTHELTFIVAFKVASNVGLPLSRCFEFGCIVEFLILVFVGQREFSLENRVLCFLMRLD